MGNIKENHAAAKHYFKLSVLDQHLYLLQRNGSHPFHFFYRIRGMPLITLGRGKMRANCTTRSFLTCSFYHSLHRPLVCSFKTQLLQGWERGERVEIGWEWERGESEKMGKHEFHNE